MFCFQFEHVALELLMSKIFNIKEDKSTEIDKNIKVYSVKNAGSSKIANKNIQTCELFFVANSQFSQISNYDVRYH